MHKWRHSYRVNNFTYKKFKDELLLEGFQKSVTSFMAEALILGDQHFENILLWWGLEQPKKLILCKKSTLKRQILN